MLYNCVRCSDHWNIAWFLCPDRTGDPYCFCFRLWALQTFPNNASTFTTYNLIDPARTVTRSTLCTSPSMHGSAVCVLLSTAGIECRWTSVYMHSTQHCTAGVDCISDCTTPPSRFRLALRDGVCEALLVQNWLSVMLRGQLVCSIVCAFSLILHMPHPLIHSTHHHTRTDGAVHPSTVPLSLHHSPPAPPLSITSLYPLMHISSSPSNITLTPASTWWYWIVELAYPLSHKSYTQHYILVLPQSIRSSPLLSLSLSHTHTYAEAEFFICSQNGP